MNHENGFLLNAGSVNPPTVAETRVIPRPQHVESTVTIAAMQQLIDELPEQTSLDFEQTARTDPIIEQRMRYEGVHAEFVSPKETTPTADGQFFFFGR